MSASPTEPGERLVDNRPDAELLHIEHIIRELEKEPNNIPVIDASLSLIRRFYQAARDGLSTNEGDLLLAPYRPSEDQRRLATAFPGCERGGGNGFPRKDKLKSHFESVHRGRGIPPRQPRALAPK
ncbi:MAG: hypothetical protein L6R36_009296 [Xanthoria steineri]|nr:MAG: hypothetical protein L6R36_009296 [Xanthoria steineri]